MSATVATARSDSRSSCAWQWTSGSADGPARAAGSSQWPARTPGGRPCTPLRSAACTQPWPPTGLCQERAGPRSCLRGSMRRVSRGPTPPEERESSPSRVARGARAAPVARA
eukprot:scaffold1942_cov351-Prasinococcus_capsulatus_cf.AAC.6